MATTAPRPMTAEEKKVIFASSLGTVFEWYDFYLYGSLAAIIAKQFFAGLDPSAAFIFALLAFAAGFIVRPFGALVFGRLGDMIGRKYTFLVTILLMGLSTFIVGILPTYASIGVAAPIILIVLRMLQGLALGGEYGGAATYVAEHAPHGRRGAYTAWIQTTATLGLFLSLMVILGTRTAIGEAAFADWGWRIPFIVSILLLAISVWIRLSMNESPAFQKMKSEGKTSKAPLAESFGQWKNLKIVLLALFGLVAGQAVVWYSGQFYALFFLTSVLKVDGATANILVALSLIIGTPFFVVFGSLSDKIGRKPIILAGLLLAVVTYFPLFNKLTEAANPDLAKAQKTAEVTVTAAAGDCSFQGNPVAREIDFTKSCDIAKRFLAQNSVSYSNATAAEAGPAVVKIGFPDEADPPEPRFISAVCGGVQVACVYVPNGRTLDNPHYMYKLRWLSALHRYAVQPSHGDQPFAAEARERLLVAAEREQRVERVPPVGVHVVKDVGARPHLGVCRVGGVGHTATIAVGGTINGSGCDAARPEPVAITSTGRILRAAVATARRAARTSARRCLRRPVP